MSTDMSEVDRGRLDIEDIRHSYGSQKVLDGVSLNIEDGEFVTLLGPSGCGKTTLLRIIAGFIRPDSGRIMLQREDVTDVPPHKRWTNIVFQRPTLFPHLDVFDNVAFGLRLEKLGRDEIKSRVAEALRLVQLEKYAHRRAHELSGGQMQRVCLARGIVLRPKVLLLDEPLSALDLRIRMGMETELRRLHRETGATFVYVTHDQREALALSDRVVVMNEGQIEQVGSAEEIYSRPTTEFAARFVGNSNLLPVSVLGQLPSGETEVRLADHTFRVRSGDEALPESAWLVVRSESVRAAKDGEEALLTGKVIDVTYRGTDYSCEVAVDGLDQPINLALGADQGLNATVGSELGLSWPAESSVLIAR